MPWAGGQLHPATSWLCPSGWSGSTGGIIEDSSQDPPIRTVTCWGDGTFGQTNVPVTSVTNNVKWFSVAAADTYTCKRARSACMHQLRELLHGGLPHSRVGASVLTGVSC